MIPGYRAVLARGNHGPGSRPTSPWASRSIEGEPAGVREGHAAAPEVLECHNVTGTFEYLIRVENGDLAAFKDFRTEVLGALPQVATITTYVVMESPKDARA